MICKDKQLTFELDKAGIDGAGKDVIQPKKELDPQLTCADQINVCWSELSHAWWEDGMRWCRGTVDKCGQD